MRCVAVFALFYNTPPNLYTHILTTCRSGVMCAPIYMYMCSFCALFCIYTLSYSLHGRSGVVLTFYSNQQCFDSLDGVRVSVNAATDHGVEFAEDLINVCIHVLSYTLYIVCTQLHSL